LIFGGLMLKYMLILLILITIILYIYSMESPIHELIMTHATSYYVAKVYYVIVNEIAKEVINERIVSKIIAEPFIDLSCGSTSIPTIVVKSVNSPPPYYIRLLAYDEYTGSKWLLSKSKEYLVTVNYQVLKKISLSSRNSECYIIREEILNSNAKLGTSSEIIVACYGTDEAYIRIKLGNTTFFTLNNETIVPLPADFLTSTVSSMGFNASHIIPLILTYIIPIPSLNSSNVTLTLYIDETLRYIKIRSKLNYAIDSLLIVNDGYGEIKREKTIILNKYTIDYEKVCSKDFKPLLIMKDDVCFKSLIKFVKDTLCEKGMANPSLGFIARTFIDRIEGLTSYGPVDLSGYVNDTCRDLASIFLLKAHKGVCIHYASALSVILKVLGFNARLATGLVRVAYANVNNSGLYVGFYIPHAWSEVLVPEGYMAFDPTPSQGGEGSIPSYGTAINMYRAYRYRERAEEPYPGIKVLMKRALGEPPTYTTHIPKDLTGIYNEVIGLITANITYVITILLILVLILNSDVVLQGLAKLLKLLGIRRGDIKSLAKEVLSEVYDDLGLTMPKHLTLRELVKSIKDKLDQELLMLLEHFTKVYEELRYGGRGNVEEVMKYAKLILRRLRGHAIT